MDNAPTAIAGTSERHSWAKLVVYVVEKKRLGRWPIPNSFTYTQKDSIGKQSKKQ